jgi:hypothetical protein
MIRAAYQPIWLDVNNEIDLSLPGLDAFLANAPQALLNSTPSPPPVSAPSPGSQTASAGSSNSGCSSGEYCPMLPAAQVLVQHTVAW